MTLKQKSVVRLLDLHDQGCSIAEICRKTRLSPNTVLRYIRNPSYVAKPRKVSPGLRPQQQKDLTIKDVEGIIQRLMPQDQPQDQPSTTTAKQRLDQEKQNVSNLKDEQELLELLEKKLNGWPVHDSLVIEGAPKCIQRELQKHHISLIC